MFEDSKLKVFMTVAEQESFTKAAKSLGISQPAVSQNIADLEKAIGAQLFDRNRGSVTLTGKGRLFKEYAGQILHWYSETEAIFSPEMAMRGRKVRIGIAAELADMLPSRLTDNFFAGEKETEYIILPYGSKPVDIEIWEEDGMVKAQASKDFVHTSLFRRIIAGIV